MSVLRRIVGLPAQVGTLLIKAYRVVFFWLPSSCRFEPSCSRYFVEAVETHGPLRGTLLGAQRICRCHPWGGCGCDPVPPRAMKLAR